MDEMDEMNADDRGRWTADRGARAGAGEGVGSVRLGGRLLSAGLFAAEFSDKVCSAMWQVLLFWFIFLYASKFGEARYGCLFSEGGRSLTQSVVKVGGSRCNTFG